MKKILASSYNFLLAMCLMTIAGASAYVAAIPALIVTVVCLIVPASYGSAFSGFITAGSEYNGKEMEEIIIRPYFVGQLPKEMGIKVISTVKSTIKLTFWGSKSKILKAYADGFQGGTGATKVQKKMELKEFKAEAEYSKQDYKAIIQDNITNVGGIKQNDITGTDVHNAEVSVFMSGVKEDIRRIFWLGDKNKKTLNALDYYNTAADVDYNVINGIWAAIFPQTALYTAPPTNDQITRIPMANGTVAQVDTSTLTGTSGTANINVDGVNYLATFTTNLTTSAANFVTSHSAALALRNITVTSSGADIIFTASLAGQPHLVLDGANVSGDLDSTNAETTANTPAADLATDEAKSTFKLMWNKSSKVLKALIKEGNVRLWVTDTFEENYLDTLEAQTLESSRTAMIDGVPRKTYRGVPLMPMSIDEHLSADFNEPYPHRAILTPSENLVLIVNGMGDDSEVLFWFNKDENKNRQRIQFEMGADFVLPEIMTVAY